jgi:hypothetical protein
MSQIYPLSDNVIIWIGPESEDSTHALETLWYFSEQVEYIISHRWGDAPNAQERDWWRDGHTLPYEKKTWKFNILAAASAMVRTCLGLVGSSFVQPSAAQMRARLHPMSQCAQGIAGSQTENKRTAT